MKGKRKSNTEQTQQVCYIEQRKTKKQKARNALNKFRNIRIMLTRLNYIIEFCWFHIFISIEHTLHIDLIQYTTVVSRSNVMRIMLRDCLQISHLMLLTLKL